jgi:hypothetical protein
MSPRVDLLCYQEASPSDLKLARLAEFLGVGCNVVALGRSGDAASGGSALLRSGGSCIMASAVALGRLAGSGLDLPRFTDQLFQRARFAFVYGFCPRKLEVSVAGHLTRGLVSFMSSFNGFGHEYQVASSSPFITKEFSGLSFGPIRNDIDFGFVLSSESVEFSSLISIGGLPFWGTLKRGNCAVFLLGCTDIADVNEKTDGTIKAFDHFSRLLPAAMFLKYALGESCWHNPRRFANLIIDDPLLHESYGFLNYRRLLRGMDECGFASTVAFIPWNYRRSDKKIAKLFRDRSDRFSVCVHGCDHSQAEFGDVDLGKLNSKVRLASKRMKAHEALTGVTYAAAMVFPQGKFSSHALRALKCNNYLAAINTDAVAADLGDEHDLTIGDFLDLAITRSEGFPLFLRKYPGELADLAFVLFFDKPLLLVEHHQYFKDDCRKALEFIRRVNTLNADLEWKGLWEILVRSYVEREVSQGIIQCKIYTNHQIIENWGARDGTYLITKDESGTTPIQGVFVNGKKTPFVIAGNSVLRLQVEIPAKSSATIRIHYRNILPDAERREHFMETTQVLMRRVLSEFRDNVLCKNDLLLSAAHQVRKRLLR